MKSLSALLMFAMLIASAPAFAESFLTLDVLSHRVGDRVVFKLIAPISKLHEQLNCRLTAGEASILVVATATGNVDTDELVGKTYRLALPQHLSGPVTLTVADVDATPVMFMVEEAVIENTASEQQEEYPTLSSFFGLAQPYLDNISAYEPIYFLVGVDPEESKFQISFKYRPFTSKGTLNKNLPWLQGFHLAYTQTSFWDLKSESTPFQDTSYKPEVFFLTPNSSFRPTGIDGLFFQLGYQHESNGRAEPESRSTNYLYLKSIFVWYNESTQLGLGIAPKVWTYVNNDNQTNPDLSDYRGYFQVNIRAGKADGLILGTDLRWAKEGGSIQADLTYPISQFLGDNLDIYLQLQYVNALAESLINYQDRTEAFRIGFALVR